MSKTLRTAALVVGAVALVATGVGAAGGLALGAAATGASAAAAAGVVATAATVSSIATFAAAGLSLAATLSAKKPKTSLGGDQTKFTANKDQGIPYVMGRTSVSGFIVHRQTNGSDNLYQTFYTIWSGGGPIHGIEAFKVDGVPVSFAGGAALGGYAKWMWLDTQLGATPEPALASPIGNPAGWDAASRTSGYAAYAWTLKYDTKGKVFAAGVPEPSAIVSGVMCYDPRFDDTYPGGQGPVRLNDESTWVYREEPFLHGLTWLLGRRQNGRRVLGVGVPIDGIDVAAYIEATNIAAANGWHIGGVVYSTDAKWDALKSMLQAGGGQPCRVGALISCTINAPRVSLDTIRSSDIVGDASVAGTQARRERINTVVPRYRSEAHDWAMVPAAPVRVEAYVTDDGGQRSKEIEFPLVQDAGQAAELAAYEIVNAREFGPITLPLKTRWIGYKPGDCLTIDVPDLNLVGQTAIILNRSLDPSTGIVTLTLRSETAAKHDFALGRTANPPPTPSLQVIDPSQLLVPGISAVWDAVANPNGTKPDDNATNSADPNSPLGPNGTVGQAQAAIAKAVADIDQLQADVDKALAQSGGSEAGQAAVRAAQEARDLAIAARDAAKGSSDAASTDAGRAQGFAKVADEARAAAATYAELTASVGPGVLNRNPDFAAWPDDQPIPSNWINWSVEQGASITRIAGVNGNPYAARMVTPADRNVGFYQVVDKPFGAYVVEATIRADNVSGAGVFVQFVRADGSSYNSGSADAYLSLMNKKDTSGWPGQTNGDAEGYLRTFSWYIATPIDGGIAKINLYVMGNWEDFGAPRRAKTIDFHSVRIRTANEAEIAQHDPIEGLGAKVSITKAEAIAADAAGNALATARNEYSAQFSGVTPSGLSNLIGQRPTVAQVDARVVDGINAAAGPTGAIGQRFSNVEVGSGGNLVPNSELVTLNGWGFDPRGTSATYEGINKPDDSWHPVSINAIVIHETGGDPNAFCHFYSELIPVEPGQFYQASVVVNAHRCNVEMYAHHYDTPTQANGNLSISGQTGVDNGDGQNLSAYRTLIVTFQARTNYIQLALMKWGTRAGQSDSWAWFLRPQLIRVPAAGYPLQPYRPSANVAAARFTQVALQDAQGKLASYLRLQAVAGTSDAELVVMAEAGKPSRILIRAGQIILDGEVISPYTVDYLKMNLPSFTSSGADTDTATYTATSPGYIQATGLLALIPNIKPSGKIRLQAECVVSFSSAGTGTNVFDSFVMFRLLRDSGTYEDFGIPADPRLGAQRVSIDVTTNFLATGNVQIQCFLYRGGTDEVDGEPGVPRRRSVNISANDFSASATWTWV